jgi:hypothetical protein
MRFSYEDFMEDIESNSLWPNNLDVDWQRIYNLALNLHNAVEEALDEHQSLVEGLILMEWFQGVTSANYRVLRQQMLGMSIDGKGDMKDILNTVLPKKGEMINIDLSSILEGNGIQDILKSVETALRDNLGKGKQKSGEYDSENPVQGIIDMLSATGNEEGSEESFERMFDALKNAVLDSNNEEE